MSCGLHDVLSFEESGRPAVLVASSVFAETASAQATALGQPELRCVLVPHPVQDRTDEEVRALAREALDPVLDALA